MCSCILRGVRRGGCSAEITRNHTSTVSRESRPRSLMKCEVAVTFFGSTFWKFFTTSITRVETSSFGKNPPDANERDHSAGASRRGADEVARGAMRTAALNTAVRALLRSVAREDILSN